MGFPDTILPKSSKSTVNESPYSKAQDYVKPKTS